MDGTDSQVNCVWLSNTLFRLATDLYTVAECGKADTFVYFTFSMSMKMSLRQVDPSKGAVENLREKMEAQKEEHKGGSSNGGGLSAGATAGITIGVTLLVGILIIALLSWRRRKNLTLNASQGGYETFSHS